MHTIPQTIYAQVSTKSAALRGEPNMPIDLQESSDLIPNFPWVSDGELVSVPEKKGVSAKMIQNMSVWMGES